MIPPPDLICDNTALFADFDGTLAEIAARPDLVRVREATREALIALDARLGGALAIVTGREIAAIDRFLSPLQLPVAGIHGLTRRDATGRLYEACADTEALAGIQAALSAFAERMPGLLVEPKGLSVALHYRARPELAEASAAAMEDAVAGICGLEVKRGQFVLEAKPSIADKGVAIRDFMAEPPFAGRIPVFAGDDITDEDGFAAVNALGGATIKIGPGDSAGRYRLATTADFLDWLETAAMRGKGQAR